jgi:hypothetical protein
MAVVRQLLQNPEEGAAMARAGREVIRSRQGATERHAELLMSFLNGGGE